MTPDSLQNDLDSLRTMRKKAQSLDVARDPLFSGAVAQLIGIIDGLLRVCMPPTGESRNEQAAAGATSGAESP